MRFALSDAPMGPKSCLRLNLPEAARTGFRQPGGRYEGMVANANQARREFVAFHGDPARKAFYLERLRNHVRKDDVIQGAAEWNGGSWGVIGCTVHSSDRSRYEADLGIPTEVASLEEIIFERLPEEEAKRFSLEFLEAVPVGTDLSFVWPAIARWLLIDPKCGIIRFAQTPETRAAILLVADLYARVLRHEPVSPQRFRDAVQIAGPLGEGVAAQVVSGAAEAVFDTTQITAWTVGRACLIGPEQMWPAIKAKLLDLLRSARAHRSPAPLRQLRLAAAS
jgi:hypothetical protein